jgi:amidohydrolase
MNKFILLITFILATSCLFAQKTNTALNTACEKVLLKVIEWRRHLHEHPELSNREVQTAAFVEAHLRALGMEVRTHVAKTGVVGILKGGLPGPVIGLRADMDGLPVKERANLPYASKVRAEFNGQEVDVMHACGHDSHIAMLLGTAEVLTGLKDRLKGTVVFIFQPAEEGPPSGEEGGAPLMVREGVMDSPKIDAIFGIHIDSKCEVGTIRYRSGAFMASSDWFTVRVHGKGSHGSQPWNGIDPIVVGSQIIQGFQTIVSRQEDLTRAPVVITVGKINGGVRENIIPEEMVMSGTIRTLDSAMQREVHERMLRTVQNIAEASGATADLTIENKTLVTFNNPDLVREMLPSLQKSADKVEATNWRTGAEDFSFYGQKAPAFFFNVGGMPKGMKEKDMPAHHTPDFYIDDSRLDVGVKAFCNLVMDFGSMWKE